MPSFSASNLLATANARSGLSTHGSTDRGERPSHKSSNEHFHVPSRSSSKSSSKKAAHCHSSDCTADDEPLLGCVCEDCTFPADDFDSINLDSPMQMLPSLVSSPHDIASPSQPASLPLNVTLHPTQNLLYFFMAFLSPDSFASASPAANAWLASSSRTLNLPELKLPSSASASVSEIRTFAMLNCWRSMTNVREAMQYFFARPSPFDMVLCLRAERLRTSGMPFGVVIHPIHPRPFTSHRPWANNRAAEMLGYEPQLLREMLRVRRSAFSLYHPDYVAIIETLPIYAVSRAKRALTFRMHFIRKDGSTLETMMSVLIRYFEGLPMYAVLFIQELPPSIPYIIPPGVVVSRCQCLVAA